MVAEGDGGCGIQEQAGCLRGREDPSSEEAGPVAELTRLPPGYPALLEELKTRSPQLRAVLMLNQETIRPLVFGQDLSSRFAAEGWGTKVVDRPAKDLGTEFPGVESSASATFATCVPSPRRGPTRKFCSLLQNCPGVMVCRACSTV